MQNILYITITATNANRSLFSSESKEMPIIQDTIETAIKKYNGTIFASFQKVYYVLFENDLALSCSLEIFNQLLEVLGNKNIRALRVTLGAGSIFKLDNFYLGQAVLQAERLNAICPPGQILLTKELFTSLPSPQHTNIYDYGSHRLIDLEEPVHLIGTTSNALINPTRISDKKITVPTNLPLHPTPLINRSNELRDLKNILLDNRITTIIGPSGVGKSRIGQHVAAECHKIFPSGVFYFSLTDHLDLYDQTLQIASQIGLIFNSRENIQEQLIEYLSSKKILFVFDSPTTFSQLQISFFREIINKTHTVRLLLLSRTSVNLAQEILYKISNLSLPQKNATPLELFYGSPNAVTLFLSRALYMHPEITITAQDTETITKICRLLNGNPQAIIMAAAWAKTIHINQLVNTLEKLIPEFSEQEHKVAGMPSRNNQLRAMFEATLQNLNTEEYESFIKVSLFKHSFLAEDAASATNVTATTLTRLFNKSPLQCKDGKRYFMHQVFQRIAYEELLSSPYLNAVHTSYYQFFLEATSKKSLQLTTTKHLEASEFYHRDKVNIFSAWHLCLNNGSLEEIENFITPLFSFINLSKEYLQGISLFEPLQKTLEDPLISSSGMTIFCRAKLLSSMAVCYSSLNLMDKSASLFNTALELWRILLEQPDIVKSYRKLDAIHLEHAQTLVHYSELLSLLNNRPKALQYAFDGLKIFTQLKRTNDIAWTQNIIGVLFLNSETPNKAIEHFKESLTHYQYGNSPTGIKTSQKNLAHCYYNSGNFTEAQKYYSIDDYEKRFEETDLSDSALVLSDKDAITPESLFTLATVHHEMGNFITAFKLAERGLVMSTEEKDQLAIADAIALMATIHTSMGNYKKSKIQLQEALDIYQQLNYTAGINRLFVELARLHYYMGKFNLMSQYLRQVAPTALGALSSKYFIDYETIKGLEALCKDAIPTAEELFQKAYRASTTIQYENGAIRAIKNLVHIEVLSGNTKKSIYLFSELITLASSSGLHPVILESMVDLSHILVEKKDFEYAMDILIYIYNHKASNAYTKTLAKKKLFKLPPKYGKQFFFYCINNEEHRDIKEFSRSIISYLEIAFQH